MTALEIVKEEVARMGRQICDESADYLLWEHTGFPRFFDGDPEKCLREQVRAALESELE